MQEKNFPLAGRAGDFREAARCGWQCRAVHCLGAAMLAGAVLTLAGCGLLGAAEASKGRPVTAEYTGMPNKSVAIVIYLPPATIDEYSGARQEISQFVAAQMRQHLPTTRLLNPREVIDWQNNTLNWFALPEKDIGKHFSVDRVLYIEVADYSTKRSIGYSDLQGHLKAQCKVFEVDGTSDAPAWTGTVDASWPVDRPLDPTQTNDSAVRVQTLEMFSKSLVEYFYDHQDKGMPLEDR